MADESQAGAAPAQAQTEKASIEQIASEFGIKTADEGRQETATPQTESAPQTPEVAAAPDPVTDPDGFRAWQTEQQRQMAHLQGETAKELHALRSAREAEAQAQADRELNAIVDRVHQEFAGVDRKWVKYALADRYNEDAAFKAIVDNRHLNAEALNKALGVLKGDLETVFSTRSDPQVVENQRAVDEAMRASPSSSTPEDSSAKKLMDMSEAEFEQNWHRLIGR